MELKVTGLWGFCLNRSSSFARTLHFNYHRFQPIKNDVWLYVETSAGSQETHIHQANNMFIYHLGWRSGRSDSLKRLLRCDNLHLKENFVMGSLVKRSCFLFFFRIFESLAFCVIRLNSVTLAWQIIHSWGFFLCRFLSSFLCQKLLSAWPPSLIQYCLSRFIQALFQSPVVNHLLKGSHNLAHTDM